jgi:predicted alpha/beta-hydrolase family hydrolase
VAGRRVAVAPPRLDVGWTAALAALPGAAQGPLVVGGRSAGARVACRTAAATGAAAVVCLAFPLHPPGRPERSRAAELELVDVPLLVVQGTRDAFGRPEEVAAVVGPACVRSVPGDHGKPAEPAAVGSAVVDWLASVVAAGR